MSHHWLLYDSRLSPISFWGRSFIFSYHFLLHLLHLYQPTLERLLLHPEISSLVFLPCPQPSLFTFGINKEKKGSWPQYALVAESNPYSQHRNLKISLITYLPSFALNNDHLWSFYNRFLNLIDDQMWFRNYPVSADLMWRFQRAVGDFNPMVIKLAVGHQAVTEVHKLRWRGWPINNTERRVAWREELRNI